MSSRRVLKVAEAIREVVSMAILTELRDPRVKGVTVTFVEVSPDLRMARVHVSIMGSESKQALCLKGLENACGFLQKRINDRIETRYTPRLTFKLDQGVKNSIAVAEILNRVLPKSEPTESGLEHLASGSIQDSDEFDHDGDESDSDFSPQAKIDVDSDNDEASENDDTNDDGGRSTDKPVPR
jgi:ribosome-binding factor A